MSKLLCNVLKISGGQMSPLVARLLATIFNYQTQTHTLWSQKA